MTKGKYKRKRERAQERTQQEHANPIPPLNQVIESEHKGNSSDTGKSNAGKKKEVSMSLREIAKRSSISDWCLVAFTCALAGLGYFQFKTMNSQLNVMQSDERAWLEFDVQPDKTALQITGGQPVIYPFQIANIGKTPATHIYGKIFVDLLDATQEVPIDHVEGEEYPYNSFTSGIIFPATNTKLEAVRVIKSGGGARVATGDEVTGVGNRTVYMAVYGIITYRDTFGVDHWTRFCKWQGKSGGTYQAKKCTEYNNVDSK